MTVAKNNMAMAITRIIVTAMDCKLIESLEYQWNIGFSTIIKNQHSKS